MFDDYAQNCNPQLQKLVVLSYTGGKTATNGGISYLNLQIGHYLELENG